MEIAVDRINVNSNPRTDFGNIDELAASVGEKGIIEPLVVKKVDDENYELIAGERRLRAAKAVGLEKVPVSIREGDSADIEEVKLIENIHRKDFNPVEEGKAFQKYMKAAKASVDTLADKIAKPKLYIQKRLELLKLPEDIQKSISERKISMGHGLVIARLKTVKEQKKLLREIIREKLSVNHAEREIVSMDGTVNLSDATFDKSECKGCQYNGGEQSMLFETGSEIKGHCLNKKCFHTKTIEYIKQETKKLKEKGINVLSEKQIEKIERKQTISKYDSDYKDIRKRLAKEPEVFAVSFRKDYWGNKIEKQIYCIKPSQRYPKNGGTPKDEKVRDQNAKDKLNSKVSDFKRNFLINKTREMMQPSTKESKAMTLFALLKEGTDYNDEGKLEIAGEIVRAAKLMSDKYGYTHSFQKILALDESEIDRLISKASGIWVKSLYDDQLGRASANFGVSLTEHFQINEEYLKLYTKDALIALAKEIGLGKHLENRGIEKWEKAKRGDMISYFLNEGFDLKGKVPKIMAKAR